MTIESTTIVHRLWNYCNVLRDYGVSYGDYVEQLTYLLFLKMADETGGGSYGFSQERLAMGLENLVADKGDMNLESFKGLFRTRPVLVYPGKSTGRMLMNMIAVIPKEASPVLYLTPDSPNMYEHAKFRF